jgi:hypothetical protein
MVKSGVKMNILKRIIFIFLLLILLIPKSGSAQSYLFELTSQTVDYYLNEDGSASILYEFIFNNDPYGDAIDYIDVGLPNPNFDFNSIQGEVNGQPVEISRDYQGEGNAGVAIALGNDAIQPGQTGTVRLYVGQINRVLFPDSQDPNYVSTNFSPTYFSSQFVQGESNLTVSFHFPLQVQPEEPRWHPAPKGWAEEPGTGFDEEGRIIYTWNNPAARPDVRYEFGASYPAAYAPVESVSKPTLGESVEDSFGINPEAFVGWFLCCGVIGFIVFVVFSAYRSTQKRKMQYLPPKVAIEGHGIKRGLTAVEAAILLEEPIDKVLTMILFSVVKKGAVEVVKQEPLEIKSSTPLPDSLRAYETQFIQAMIPEGKLSEQEKNKARKTALQDLMIDLVKSVSKSMKGFSRKETIAYYKDIMRRAWAQVESAETPEIKMERFSDNLEWTMLDRNYDDKTRDVFTGPVIIPTWWHRFDPTYPSTPKTASLPSSRPGTGSAPGGGFTMPTLPGSAFAASMVRGVQTFSTNVVGNITEFTGNITQKTNPIPISTTSSGSRSSGGRSGGSGCACACACACAGCACACAGGGR